MKIVLLITICACLAVAVSGITVGSRYPPHVDPSNRPADGTNTGKLEGGSTTTHTITLEDGHRIMFNGGVRNQIYFNNNGFITFDGFLSTSVRYLDIYPASNSEIIAPFWLNTDPRCGAITYDVVYKKDNSNAEIKKVLDNVNEDILNALVPKLSYPFDAEAVAIFTFKAVGPGNAGSNCQAANHNTFQLVVATDDTTSYALFLYESLEYYETMSNMKLQYAIAAVGSGGGLLNKITNVSSVSGTIGVKNLPNMSGNVMISANPGTNHKGFFVLDISSAMSQVALAAKVHQMMAKLQEVAMQVQRGGPKPYPYRNPASVQGPSPYYYDPVIALAQRLGLTDALARYQEESKENSHNNYRYFD